MEYLCITQARLGSSRLPGKVFKEVAGKTLLEHHVNRLRRSRFIDDVLIATTDQEKDDPIAALAEQIEVSLYRGAEEDVLDRYYQAAQPLQPKVIVRVTSDCPLIDPYLIDEMIQAFEEKALDYFSNAMVKNTFPHGTEVEIFTFEALTKAWEEARLPSEREHVAPYIWKNSTVHGGNLFKSEEHIYKGPDKYGSLRITVDEPEDLELVEILINELGPDKKWEEYAEYILQHKDLKDINKGYDRKEGYLKSLNQDRDKN